MNDFFKIPTCFAEILEQDELLLIVGGSGADIVNNGKTCNATNNNASCSVTNSGGSCGITNNGNSCNANDTPPPNEP